jgi:arylsulfatase A
MDRRTMDRRNFVALLTSAGLGVVHPVAATRLEAGEAGLPAGAAGQAGKGRRRPNVIFMICDDLGFGDLSCYGSKLPTPNLDAMARAGARFVHYNSAHPICSASRAAILTGRYGLRSKTAGAFGPTSEEGTSLDETLLSELFLKGGYSTKAIGKWHLGNTPGYLPTDRGFESFYGVPWSDDMYPLPLMRNGEVLERDTDRTLLTPRYTSEAVGFIEQQSSGERPFFLYMAFSYPHDPARASERFRGKTGFGDYGDAVAEIDWSVGEMLGALDRRGLANDTIVCFTSDHGPWYQGSPGWLRGRKGTAFEGGFRVPFLLRWPGVTRAGQTETRWSSALDIVPTLVARCGLDLPQKPLDGVDASRIWTGEGRALEAEAEARPVLYFCAMGNGGLDVHCLRRERWKHVWRRASRARSTSTIA